MSQLLDVITRQMSGEVVNRMSREIGADSGATEGAIAAALPLLLGSLARNAQQPDGAESLDRALAKDHDGSLLDNLLSGLTGGSTVAEGGKILGHMFGGRQPAVRHGVGRASGLQPDQVTKLMAMLAPVVMGALGRMRRQENLGAADIAGRLGRERDDMVSGDSALGGLLTNMLDRDGDGSVMDDIGGQLLKGFLRPR
ncbi:MAG: DUF937 domain-containing protein [Gemmatimonadota bacterium]